MFIMTEKNIENRVDCLKYFKNFGILQFYGFISYNICLIIAKEYEYNCF